MRTIVKIILFFFLIGALTSCGFQKRGPQSMPPEMQRVYLQAQDPYGLLAKDLRQSLKLSGVTIVKSPADATMILTILKEEKSQQLLSVSGTQQTRQYNLILSVTFQLDAPNGRVMTAPVSLSETRAITTEANQILADSNEANYLYQRMYQEISYDMLNRLASKEVATILMNNK